jgi:ElaB/YqjD/DUF883 family membrane-anchored ribosome-binding protein
MSNGMNDSTRRAFEDTAATIGDELRHGAEAGAERVKQGFSRASESLDDAAEVAGEALDATRERLGKARRRAARAASDSADYFRENGPRGVARDVEGVIRKHPGMALMVCAAVGFLIGRSLKKAR